MNWMRPTWMRSLPRVRTALVTAACAATSLTIAAAPASASPGARYFGGLPSVGVLFPSGTGNGHSCVGTVIASPTRNLVVTAAHCVSGYGTTMVFVPGYSGGRMPYGSWQVRLAHVDSSWRLRHDPSHDIAVLEISSRGGRAIQDVTGGLTLGTAPGWNAITTVPAYRSGRNDLPIRCTTRVRYAGDYPEFDCRGYPDGVSGSPFIVGRTITGVIGGLYQGGCTPSASYSSPFNSAMINYLTSSASNHDYEAWIPASGGDGC